MKKIFLIIFLSLLTSCANAPVGWGGKYEVVQSNSKSITIKYDTILGANSIYEPANEHCKKFDKEPVKTTKTKDALGIAVQTFECR